MYCFVYNNISDFTFYINKSYELPGSKPCLVYLHPESIALFQDLRYHMLGSEFFDKHQRKQIHLREVVVDLESNCTNDPYQLGLLLLIC